MHKTLLLNRFQFLTKNTSTIFIEFVSKIGLEALPCVLKKDISQFLVSLLFQASKALNLFSPDSLQQNTVFLSSTNTVAYARHNLAI